MTEHEIKLQAQRALEKHLSSILRGLLDRPDNVLLMQQLAKHNLHVSDISIQINLVETSHEKFEREMWVMDRWQKLHTATRRYKWSEFVDLCAAKVDINAPWQKQIAQALGMTYQSMLSYKAIDFVPFEWMEKVAALPARELPPIKAALTPRGKLAAGV